MFLRTDKAASVVCMYEFIEFVRNCYDVFIIYVVLEIRRSLF